MPLPRHGVRNARLLVQSGLQHLVDDPVLLAVQMSRRLPFRARVATGRALRRVAGGFRSGQGLAALGAVMAGEDIRAEQTVMASAGLRSRLGDEVAVLLDRSELVTTAAPAPTRARVAWNRGDLSAAIAILQDAGRGDSRYARRLRSELTLVQPGYKLPAPARPRRVRATPAEDEPLRVLHLITNSLPHTQSGYSLRTHRILTALRGHGIASVALTRAGYPVMVGIPTAADEDVIDGIRYVRTLPARPPQIQEERLQATVERALELVEEFRPHVLHTTTNYQNALVAQAVAERTGLPWVLEVRGLMEKTWVASHRSDTARAQAAASEKHQLISDKEGEQARAADAVVTLSEAMADELVSRGVDRETITIVPNGVDESFLDGHVGPAEARATVGLARMPGFSKDAFLVGAVSALVEYEGFDVLLRAVAHIAHDLQGPADLRARIGVVLAGDGVARPGLAVLADELGIADRVHLPGRVPREHARHWVEALDVVVVPRRDVAVTRAVTPQKPIEAMALGRPVVASDLAAIREVVSGADGMPHAVLVPPEDPLALAGEITRLAAYPRAGEGRRETAELLARERTWPEQVRRYRDVYERVGARSEGGESAAP